MTVMDRVANMGEVTHRSVSARDVTAQYYDLEARLKNALATRQKYEDLLKRASSVEETLKVQKELTKTQELIERFQGRPSTPNHYLTFF